MPEKQTATDAHLQVERAIDELRRQLPVVIVESGAHAIANMPAEFIDERSFAHLRPFSLLISAARAKTLGMPALDSRIDLEGLSFAHMCALFDPLSDAALPPITSHPASAIDGMALKLAKYASLLPALLLADASHTPHALRVNVQDLQSYIAHPQIDLIETAHAALPIEGAENSRIISFRSRHATAVHLALIVGDEKTPANPLTRIHSSCVTGDILGSLRCDCGDQLKLALQQITQAGSGILIYLHQEGRGIGITNKLRAYQLQERGIDTYDANLMLGYAEDERDFSIAAAMLKTLGATHIRMLTNNPQKIAALEKAGITVSERVALITPGGKHNHAYLDAKGKKAGHLF